MAEPPGSVFVTGALGFIGRALCRALPLAGRGGARGGPHGRPGAGRGGGRRVRGGQLAGARRGLRPVRAHGRGHLHARRLRPGLARQRAGHPACARRRSSAAAPAASCTCRPSSRFSFDYPDGVTEAHPLRTNGVPVRGHEGHQRAGGAPGPRRRRAGLHHRAARRRVRPRLAPLDAAGRWRSWRRAGCCCRPWAAACSARSTWTTSWTGSCWRPRARRDVGQTFTLTDGVGVTTADFFGHYARLLGRRLRPVPTPVARALAAAAARLPGDTEVNPSAVAYVSRKGTYSIEKARLDAGRTSRRWTWPRGCGARWRGWRRRGTGLRALSSDDRRPAAGDRSGTPPARARPGSPSISSLNSIARSMVSPCGARSSTVRRGARGSARGAPGTSTPARGCRARRRSRARASGARGSSSRASCRKLAETWRREAQGRILRVLIGSASPCRSPSKHGVGLGRAPRKR